MVRVFWRKLVMERVFLIFSGVSYPPLEGNRNNSRKHLAAMR